MSMLLIVKGLRRRIRVRVNAMRTNLLQPLKGLKATKSSPKRRKHRRQK